MLLLLEHLDENKNGSLARIIRYSKCNDVKNKKIKVQIPMRGEYKIATEIRRST